MLRKKNINLKFFLDIKNVPIKIFAHLSRNMIPKRIIGELLEHWTEMVNEWVFFDDYEFVFIVKMIL